MYDVCFGENMERSMFRQVPTLLLSSALALKPLLCMLMTIVLTIKQQYTHVTRRVYMTATCLSSPCTWSSRARRFSATFNALQILCSK